MCLLEAIKQPSDSLVDVLHSIQPQMFIKRMSLWIREAKFTGKNQNSLVERPHGYIGEAVRILVKGHDVYFQNLSYYLMKYINIYGDIPHRD